MSDRSKSTEKWTAYESAGFKGEWGVNSDDPALAEAGDEIIVYPSLSEQRARLIAAAPDLLEALKAFEECFVVAGGMPFDDDTIVEMARAAIAKAEGR